MLASAATTNWKRGNSAEESETAPRPGRSRTRDSAGQNTADDKAGQRRTPTRDEKLQKVLATARSGSMPCRRTRSISHGSSVSAD